MTRLLHHQLMTTPKEDLKSVILIVEKNLPMLSHHQLKKTRKKPQISNTDGRNDQSHLRVGEQDPHFNKIIVTRNTSPPLELTDNDSIFYAPETKSINWSTTRKRFSDIKIASTSSGSKTLSSASKSISRSSVRRKLFPEDGLSRGSTAKRHCKKDIDEDTDSAKGYLKAITTSSYSGLKYKANSTKKS